MTTALTIANLAAPIAKASGQPIAKTTADLWSQINGLAPYTAAIPATIEQRLDAIYALVSAGAPPAAAATDTLPPVGFDAVLWDYSRRWVTAQWQVGFAALPFQADHVALQPNGDVLMTLDATAAADFRAGAATPAQVTGLWEADVTLPTMKEGVVVAPLWLYDGQSSDEIDFEFAGKTGLTVNIHVGGQQDQHRPVGAKDFSGQRVRFGIKVEPTKVTMLLDRAEIFSWVKGVAPLFVSHALQPFFEMWPTNPNSGWTDTFTGFALDEKMEMTVHGYRYTPL